MICFGHVRYSNHSDAVAKETHTISTINDFFFIICIKIEYESHVLDYVQDYIQKKNAGRGNCDISLVY